MAPERGPEKIAAFITKTCKRTVMNDQHPYEKHLADKLQQLPVPDVEPNWQRMRSLLDREMPRGGGYWKWFTGIGIILIMLFGGTWFIIDRNDYGTANNKQVPATENKKQIGASDDSKSSTATTRNDVEDKKIDAPISTETANRKLNDQIKILNKNSIIDDENLPTELRTSNQKTNTARNNQTRKPVINESQISNKEKSLDTPPSEEEKNTTITGNGPISNHQDLTTANPTRDIAGNNPPADDIRTSSRFKPGNLISGINVTAAVGDSIHQNYYTNLFPEPAAQKGAKSRSAKAKNILSGENKSLAVGFSLPLGFPLGDQKPGGYNINAKPNVISDFLPVPHMQYHINNKMYLQTELQFMNPQYIQPVLLFQKKNEVQATNTVYYNSVYAKKLYYFNFPLGIHYSPFQHFYLGTGLQFSSLVSGVALHEETSSPIGSNRYNLVSQRYEKFKNDTISRRLDNNEFRLMLDANYYWRQFTVGLRYNQALSNYVNFRLNNASPLFQDKNKSLQFYLRYNLWENHKKPASLAKSKK
jgi:hypothetical protein